MRPRLEQEEIRQITRRFVEQEISFEMSREIDQQDIYPDELLRKFTRTGLWALNIPEQYGGLGGRSVDAMPIYEELSRRLPVLAWVIGNIMLYGNDIIGLNGSQAQKERFLPALAQGQLRSLVERIERLEEEKKTIAGDIREVYAEAKANGFETRILRKVISLRRKEATEREEEQSMLDLYMSALGMLPNHAEEAA